MTANSGPSTSPREDEAARWQIETWEVVPAYFGAGSILMGPSAPSPGATAIIPPSVWARTPDGSFDRDGWRKSEWDPFPQSDLIDEICPAGLERISFEEARDYVWHVDACFLSWLASNEYQVAVPVSEIEEKVVTLAERLSDLADGALLTVVPISDGADHFKDDLCHALKDRGQPVETERLDASLDDKFIVLVDPVMHTGTTARNAIATVRQRAGEEHVPLMYSCFLLDTTPEHAPSVDDVTKFVGEDLPSDLSIGGYGIGDEEWMRSFSQICYIQERPRPHVS